jgi:hypothetical protein
MQQSFYFGQKLLNVKLICNFKNSLKHLFCQSIYFCMTPEPAEINSALNLMGSNLFWINNKFAPDGKIVIIFTHECQLQRKGVLLS